MSEAFDALSWLSSRRSVSQLVEPGPSDAQLRQIFESALTVPDHGMLRPFRFVVVRGEARGAFGDALSAAGVEVNPEMPDAVRTKLREKALMAPAQLVVLFSPKEGTKIPHWEQEVTAGCAGYAVTLAAHAVGLGAIWKSSPFMDGRRLRDVLGAKDGEKMLGWVNLGTPMRDTQPPRRPEDAASVASVLDAASGTPRPFQG